VYITIITCILLSGYLPSYADNTTILAQENADSTIKFQSLYWDPVFDQAKSLIWRLTTLNTLYYPISQKTLYNS